MSAPFTQEDRAWLEEQLSNTSAPFKCLPPCGRSFPLHRSLIRHRSAVKNCRLRYAECLSILYQDADPLDEDDWPGNPAPDFGDGDAGLGMDIDYDPVAGEGGDDEPEGERGEYEMEDVAPQPNPTPTQPLSLPPSPSDEVYPLAGQIIGKRNTLFERIRQRQHDISPNNIYYPFQDHAEVKFVSWITTSRLSQEKIDSLIHQEIVSLLFLSTRLPV